MIKIKFAGYKQARYLRVFLFAAALLLIVPPSFSKLALAAGAQSSNITLTAANAVNGKISIPDVNACATSQTVTVNGDGKTPVLLLEPSYWPNKIVHVNATTTEIIDQHGCSPVTTLVNVPLAYFSDGSTLALMPTKGICGSANGTKAGIAPTSNLCSTGTATAVKGKGPWTWTCTGLDGGSAAECTAQSSNITLTAANAVNGKISIPDVNACATSQTVTVNGDGKTPVLLLEPSYWPNKIVHVNATTTEIIDQHGCSPVTTLVNVPLAYFSDGSTLALMPTKGICGSANGTKAGIAPTSNLCSTGTATAVKGKGPWTWTCTGLDGGSAAKCTAQSSNITLTAANAVNGKISIPDVNACATSQTVTVNGDGKTPVLLLEPSYWPNKIVHVNATTTEIIDQHGCSPVTTLVNVPLAYFSDGSTLALMPTTLALIPTNGICGAANATAVVSAPAAGLCNAGTASAVTGTGPWGWTCAGLEGGVNASCSAPLVPQQPCIDANGASHASGSTYSVQVSQASGSTAATVAQCPYGGTQPTITTVTQSQFCTNGVSTNQGSPVTAVANTGSPTCNAPVAGVCGSANGSTASALPTTNLCATGTATSSVLGGSTYTWSCTGSNGGATATCSAQALTGSCMGTALPVLGQLVMPPDVLQPQSSLDLVGVNIQNTSSTTYNSLATFGQVFKAGQVQPTDQLVATIDGVNYQVQMDTLATWPDNSVKLGAITVDANICANAQVSALLSKATGSTPIQPVPTQVTLNTSTTPNMVDLLAAPLTLKVTLAFTSGGYSGTQTIDLAAALKSALTNNTASYWLQGPLASEARVDYPLPGGPLHLTADVTVYADRTVIADVQFNNDLATILPGSGQVNQAAPLPPLQYTATITSQNQKVSYPISQSQYTDWHVVLNSNGTLPTTLNVQHDLAYLEHTGAILPYDRTTGVLNHSISYDLASVFDDIASSMATSGFGLPLAANGVTAYMPMTGGRPDIGYTTRWNTVWLLTQDARAAAFAVAQSDTSGAVPWNLKLANGHWLTTYDNPNIWSDGRGGPNTYTDGIANAIDQTTWTPDPAHEPNLSYVPYIMTAARWHLDRLNAEAAFDLSYTWPGVRCQPYGAGCNPHTDDLVVNGQIRGDAWSLREIEEAAFIGAPNSFEQSYYSTVVSDNWNYVQSQEAALATAGGQVYGYWGLGSYGAPTAIPEWQEDYLTGIAVLGAEMGYPGALQYISWQKDAWLAARFNVPDSLGMNPYDGCNYNLTVGYTNTSGSLVPYTTWAAIENATVAAGGSNGTPNGPWSVGGDYCQLARAVLGGALTLYPSDTNLQQALTWVNGSQEYNATTPVAWQSDPTFNIVPLQ